MKLGWGRKEADKPRGPGALCSRQAGPGSGSGGAGRGAEAVPEERPRHLPAVLSPLRAAREAGHARGGLAAAWLRLGACFRAHASPLSNSCSRTRSAGSYILTHRGVSPREGDSCDFLHGETALSSVKRFLSQLSSKRYLFRSYKVSFSLSFIFTERLTNINSSNVSCSHSSRSNQTPLSFLLRSFRGLLPLRQTWQEFLK